jgi:CRISPR-associated protein Csd1
MIYRALVDLAEHEGLLQDTSYEPKEVHYLIYLGKDGKYLGYSAPRLDPKLDKRGKAMGRPQAPKLSIPRRSDRTVQDQAEFLVDKAEYVLGVDPKRERPREKLAIRRHLFRQAVNQAADALSASDALRSVGVFLEEDVPEELASLISPSSTAETAAMAAALFAFVYEPDGGVSCVHDQPEVHEYFRRLSTLDDAGGEGQCLVTGKEAPLTRLHAKPKGIPPKGVTKGGVPLTSANSDAFYSYGLKEVGCAPISREANVAIELALNRLLDPAYPRGDGLTFPKRHEVISNDTVVTYWSRGDSDLNFISECEQKDPEVVGAMLRSPSSGRPAPLTDPSVFYALILSGAQGRGVIRSFLESTVRATAENVDCYREQVCIDRPYEDLPGGYPLGVIRRALVARGDLKNLPAAFAADLYLAILDGRPFKGAVAETIVRRNRAELLPMTKTGRRDEIPLAARCSLLKAYFIRNRKENILVRLDNGRIDPPYLLGRLLAEIDKIQQDALENVNATLVDRFYGSASSTPRSVFPTLIRRSQHHLAKLRREKPGLAVNHEKLLQEVMADLTDFPATLDLEQQALFSLGFFHQRRAFFTKS